MFKKIAALLLSSLAITTAQAATQTSLVLLQNLDQVHVKWDNGVGNNKAVNFGSPGKDLLYIDIPTDGLYTFTLLRSAQSNFQASFKLFVDVGPNQVTYNSVAFSENGKSGWLFQDVDLKDKSYLFDLTVNLSQQGSGNPTFSGVLQVEEPNPGNEDGTIPEPASMALLGLGLVGLAVSRRRKA